MGGVISAVIPKSSASKAFRFLCGAVIVYTAITPLISQKIEFEKIGDLFTADAQASNQYQTDSKNTMMQAVQSGYKTLFENTLKQNNITFKSIEIECVADGDSIELKRAVIVGIEDKKTQRKVKELLSGLAGANTEFKFIGS